MKHNLNFETPTALLEPDYSASPTKCKQINLVLDTEARYLFVETRHECETGCYSSAEAQGKKIIFPLNCLLDATKLREFVESHKEDFEFVCENYTRELTGDLVSVIFKYSEEAKQVIEKLAYVCKVAVPTLEGENAGLWHARDWFLSGLTYIGAAEEYQITEETSDEDLNEIAIRLEKEFLIDNIKIFDTLNFLEEVREYSSEISVN
jgi:hypothetical protein